MPAYGYSQDDLKQWTKTGVDPHMSTTLKVLAKQAIDVQDACNLVAVIHGFKQAMQELIGLDPTGWENKNQQYAACPGHPITFMWLSKLASLNHSDCFCNCCMDNFSAAYRWCKEQQLPAEARADAPANIARNM